MKTQSNKRGEVDSTNTGQVIYNNIKIRKSNDKIALDNSNMLKKRTLLSKMLMKESMLVAGESMKILKEFEIVS
jgi:hypothetical protein